MRQFTSPEVRIAWQEAALELKDLNAIGTCREHSYEVLSFEVYYYYIII